MKRVYLILPFFFLFPSCVKKNYENEIVPPITAPLSRTVIGYGVVIANYTHVMSKHGAGGKSLGFLRKGSIVEILERRPMVNGEKTENWVLARSAYSGWLKEEELKIYDTEAKAKTAAGILGLSPPDSEEKQNAQN